MSKWVLDQYDGTELDYPTLGFRAVPDDILDATAAPDGRWSLNGDQGAAETVDRYTVGGDPSYVEPGDGHVLTWSDTGNAYEPTAPATFATTFAGGDLVFDVTKAPYSATFDGSSDDTAAIQAALDAAEDALGTVDVDSGTARAARVVLPIGYTKVTGLTIASNVTLEGQGDRTIIVLTGSSNANVIQSKNYGHRTDYDRGIRVRNLRIIGNRANQSATLCPQTAVTADTAVSTSSTTLPVHDTTGFDSSGLAWVGFQVVAYTGKTSTSLTGVTLYSGSDTLRKMTWVTPYASKGHLVAIQGAYCHVEIYGDTAVGSGIYFQGPDPIASSGVIVPENRVCSGTRINTCGRYGIEIGQNASDGALEGNLVLGPDNEAGSLLVRSVNWKFNTLHLVGTYGNTIKPIPQAILVGAGSFRGNTIYFDTWPGTTIVCDGSIQGGIYLNRVSIAQTEHFQCSWGVGAGGHGVLFRGIKNRTSMRAHKYIGLDMTGPIASGYGNGPWTRVVGSQNLASLVSNKLQVANAMDFSAASDIGGPILIGGESLTYTGRQMNFTKLTAAAAIGDTTITVADTTGFDSAGTITLLAEENESYTAQIVTYTGKTSTTFTGIPSGGAGSITATTSASGQRGQVGQHFFTGVSAGVATVSTNTSLYCDAQTVTVNGLEVASPTMWSYQVSPFRMQPVDTWAITGGVLGGTPIASWRRVQTGKGSITPSSSSPIGVHEGGAAAPGGTNGGQSIFYIDPADWPDVAKMRVRMTVTVNDTAPTSTFVAGLYPISGASSGVAGPSGPFGTVTSGSTATIAAPAIGTRTTAASADFAVPTAAGWYALGVAFTPAVVTNSAPTVRVTLDVKF